jgi:transposase
MTGRFGRAGRTAPSSERHAVMNVLSDRTSASLSTWLQAHPGVEVITRDRNTEYTRGAREGAPDAMQIADRWHLLHSPQQMLERYLPSVYARLQRLPKQATDTLDWGRTRAFPRTKAEELIRSESREQRLGVYQEVKKLRSQGWGIATIARELHINRKTARTYALADEFPELARQTARASLLDPYLPLPSPAVERGVRESIRTVARGPRPRLPGNKTASAALDEHPPPNAI